jgi:hypothetical protein
VPVQRDRSLFRRGWKFTVPKSIAAIVTVMKPWQTFTQD